MYIIFEGIDLVGKSTQIEKLKEKFPNFIFTKEPGGSKFGEKVREIILHSDYKLHHLSETLLFLSDRSEHFQKVVKPNLESGKSVVSDRGILSGLAYASINSELSFEKLLELNLLSIENRVPDIIFLFQIERGELIRRREGKYHDNIENRGLSYSLEVQEKLTLFAPKVGKVVKKIDASDSIENIEKIILETIKNY
jgi:dTMP kinase